ncbi:motility protein A [Maridesulfovibrio hydrothermalis]|uniref:Putative flagellar motor component n=1 Tax=Maridesulfovibrio hydrothermalis AM13 = DSM 14728 TaxID=1121451 RepID=L0R8Z4_9BACT|nr:MotA/TolQ/ExbB proton channel family protein [Maridesulfovibrio hydrothermalis]CCO22655.1 putative flagellar motor component [Maridesulfovibrio hydrothermalis AM13 = DSM 14728]
MDIATLIGIVGGLGLIVATIIMGGNAAGFIDPPSAVVVFGGTFASAFIMFPMSVVLKAFKIALKGFFSKSRDPKAIIDQIVALAETARKESLVALEKVAIDDEYLKKGIILVADGTDGDLVRSIMEIEIDFMKKRHFQGQAVMKGMGNMAPAFGMIGTLIGLVNMLSNLSDPDSIGPAMAVALLTTLYGAVIANVVFLPLAKKLEERSFEESLFMEIMVEGVVAIQKGEHPSIVKEKLQAFLAPAMRDATD